MQADKQHIKKSNPVNKGNKNPQNNKHKSLGELQLQQDNHILESASALLVQPLLRMSMV